LRSKFPAFGVKTKASGTKAKAIGKLRTLLQKEERGLHRNHENGCRRNTFVEIREAAIHRCRKWIHLVWSWRKTSRAHRLWEQRSDGQRRHPGIEECKH
jgi:hypothetical protein